MMTLECLNSFGIKIEQSEDLREFRTSRQNYKPAVYRIEGDWSSASYLLAMGALTGEIEVENLNPDSLQADKKILDFLVDMEASVETRGNMVTVRKSALKAIKADLTDCIDLLPTMAVLAAVSQGTSELTGIERARIKESNRIMAVRAGLSEMGIEVMEESNKMTVKGGKPEGGIIDSMNDHRIAMAFSLPGLVSGGTVINNAECVSKTYPEFWDILKSTGGRVKTDE
jgi:3-phosphoshikimate 1-carboxyvinyltransferase